MYILIRFHREAWTGWKKNCVFLTSSSEHRFWKGSRNRDETHPLLETQPAFLKASGRHSFRGDHAARLAWPSVHVSVAGADPRATHRPLRWRQHSLPSSLLVLLWPANRELRKSLPPRAAGTRTRMSGFAPSAQNTSSQPSVILIDDFNGQR